MVETCRCCVACLPFSPGSLTRPIRGQTPCTSNCHDSSRPAWRACQRGHHHPAQIACCTFPSRDKTRRKTRRKICCREAVPIWNGGQQMDRRVLATSERERHGTIIRCTSIHSQCCSTSCSCSWCGFGRHQGCRPQMTPKVKFRPFAEMPGLLLLKRLTAYMWLLMWDPLLAPVFQNDDVFDEIQHAHQNVEQIPFVLGQGISTKLPVGICILVLRIFNPSGQFILNLN